jgi:trans-aconitate methyltransferase
MSNTNQLYVDLSTYYDHFCRHIDYVDQCAFANRVYELFNESNLHQYLDLACGTGQHLKFMQGYGFEVSGLDNSLEMLDQAQIRCPNAKLVPCDLAEFENKAEFDLITCFLYSMHYSHPITSFTQTLNRTYEALASGGIFVFDMVDKFGIRNITDMIDKVDNKEEELSFNSRWYYRGEGEVLDLFLDIQRKTEKGVQDWNDHHTMTAVEITQVKNWMIEIGFQVTLLERDFQTIMEWGGESANVIVIGLKR